MSDATCREEGCARSGVLRRGYCNACYKRRHKAGEFPKFKPRDPVCRIEGCGKPKCSNPKRSVCDMHFKRLSKYGDPHQIEPPGGQRYREPEYGNTFTHSDGYILVCLPHHPLATPGSNYVYQHRVVLYDAIGPGDHLCWRCERVVTWGELGARMLVVDHINDVVDDNDPENLRPSCINCNATKHGFYGWGNYVPR